MIYCKPILWSFYMNCVGLKVCILGLWVPNTLSMDDMPWLKDPNPKVPTLRVQGKTS